MLQRVRELVTGVLDLVVPQQLHAQEFSGRVALLVKCERAGVWDALPRGFQPTPGKISDAVTRVIDLLYGETATGSAADVLAERHLPVAARRFPRAYPLEPGLWRNLLDDDRAFA